MYCIPDAKKSMDVIPHGIEDRFLGSKPLCSKNGVNLVDLLTDVFKA